MNSHNCLSCILGRLFCLGMMAVLTACTTPDLYPAISLKEHPGLNDGYEVIVLVRIKCEDVSGTSLRPFRTLEQLQEEKPDNLCSNTWVSVGLGSFETGFKRKLLQYNKSPGFFSCETRNEGWAYIYLEPGTYLLSFVTDVYASSLSRSVKEYLNDVQSWYLDIPCGSPVVYIGTVNLVCSWKRSSSGYKARQEDTTVLDESARAEAIAQEYLSELYPPRTVLIQRHDPYATIIMKTPLRNRN